LSRRQHGTRRGVVSSMHSWTSTDRMRIFGRL
jgi:hypothetical protein